MLLLITDTSGKHGSVALARAGEASDDVKVIEAVPLAGGTFSAQLVPQVAGLLQKHGLHKSDIGGFVVVSGPGSFTGLRVGLAAIKALAEILQKPIVAVSLLEVIALASGAKGRVLALLDAGRGGIFAAEYEVAGNAAQLLREELIARDHLANTSKGLAVATPDSALAAMARDFGVPVFELDSVGAEMIARLGWSKIRSGEIVSPEQLEANYFRNSDADIFAKPTS